MSLSPRMANLDIPGLCRDQAGAAQQGERQDPGDNIAKAGVHLNDCRQLGALLDCPLGIQFYGHIGATDQMDFDTG